MDFCIKPHLYTIQTLKSGLYDKVLLNNDHKSLKVETYEQFIQTNWLHPPLNHQAVFNQWKQVCFGLLSFKFRCFTKMRQRAP